MFQNRPMGSPLVGLTYAPVGTPPVYTPQTPQEFLRNPTLPPLGPLTASQEPPTAPEDPVPLPKPPASIQRKKLNMWDKEHISGTLAQISQGFGSSKDFFGGMSAAAGNVAQAAQGYREAEQGKVTIGGPDNAFKITTYPDGTVTHEKIDAVEGYISERDKAEKALKPDQFVEYRANVADAILRTPPENRQQAYSDFLADSLSRGIDLGLPPTLDEGVLTSMRYMGIGAKTNATNDATREYRAEIDADRDRAYSLRERNTESTIGARNASQARAAASAARRSSPPSTRRRKAPKLPAGFILD